MAHHQRELTDHEWAHVMLDPQVMINLDEKTKKAINGASGGTWAPSAAIEIGGAGIDLLGPAGMSGASSGIRTAAGKHIVHGRLDDEDFIALHADHEDATRQLNAFVAPASGDYANISQDGSPVINDAQTRRTGVRFFSAPLRVHNGGTIASVELFFVVSAAHASVPEMRPRLRIVRVDKGGMIEPLRIAADTDLDGFVLLGVDTSAADYVASNGVQTATYTPNVTGRDLVDTSKYVYLAEIIEESGTGAVGKNRFGTLTTHMANIAHLGPQ